MKIDFINQDRDLLVQAVQQEKDIHKLTAAKKDAVIHQLQLDIEKMGQNFETKWRESQIQIKQYKEEKEGLMKQMVAEQENHTQTRKTMDEEKRSVQLNQQIINNLQQQIQDLNQKLDEDSKTRDQLLKTNKLVQREFKEIKVQLEEERKQLENVKSREHELRQEKMRIEEIIKSKEQEYRQLRLQLEDQIKGREETERLYQQAKVELQVKIIIIFEYTNNTLLSLNTQTTHYYHQQFY